MKRILVITPDLSYPGGTEEFIKSFLVYGAKFKDKLKFYLLETCGHAKFANTVFYEELRLADIEMISPEYTGYSFWDFRKALQLQTIVDNYDIDIVHSALFSADVTAFIAKLGGEKASTLLRSIPSYSKLTNICGENIEDNTKQSIHPGDFKWISTKFCNFSIALECDTPEWILKKKIIDSEVESMISQYTDSIFGVSQTIKKKWSKWNSKVEVLPCASIGVHDLKQIGSVYYDREDLLEQYNIKNFNRIYSSASRMEPGKGTEDLLKAFAIHVQNFPNDFLLLGGEGSLFESLKAEYKEFLQIKFLGQLDRLKVFELLSISDVFCLLSYSEGFPLSVQEAMANYNIILSTNVGGIPDLVLGGIHGYLHNPGDLEAFVHSMSVISSLASDEINDMSKASRDRIEKYFLKEKIYDQYISKYIGTCLI